MTLKFASDLGATYFFWIKLDMMQTEIIWRWLQKQD